MRFATVSGLRRAAAEPWRLRKSRGRLTNLVMSIDIPLGASPPVNRHNRSGVSGINEASPSALMLWNAVLSLRPRKQAVVGSRSNIRRGLARRSQLMENPGHFRQEIILITHSNWLLVRRLFSPDLSTACSLLNHSVNRGVVERPCHTLWCQALRDEVFLHVAYGSLPFTQVQQDFYT